MNKRTWLFLLFFFLSLYVMPAIFRPMLSPDEFRYAEIPREMNQSGDYIVPRLLTVRYFEKTPLNYWTTAASFKIFGENKFALRLTPLLATLLTALLLTYWLKKTGGSVREQQLAPLIYLSGALVIGLGNVATTDALLTLWTTVSMGGFHLAAEEKSFRKRLPFLFGTGVALGLGFLTKGVIAFAVPALAVTIYLLWQKKWLDFLILPWIPLATAAVVIAPWAWAIHKAEPDFWHYFIFVEHFQRFSDSAAGQHAKPWWFLLPFFLLGLIPAGLPLLAAWSKPHLKELFKRPVMRFSAGAVVVIILFFSSSDGKLATYVLPAFAPAALAGALWYAQIEELNSARNRVRILRAGTGIFWLSAGVLIFLGSFLYLFFLQKHLPPIPLETAVWLPLLTAAGAAAFGAAAVTLKHFKSAPEFERFFLSFAIVAFVASWFFPRFASNSKLPEEEMKMIALQLKSYGCEQPLVVSWTGMMHAAAWTFRDAGVQLLEGIGELEYGNKAAVKEGKPSITRSTGQWKKFLNSPDRRRGVVFITYADEVEELQKKIDHGIILTTGGQIGACYVPSAAEKKQGDKNK